MGSACAPARAATLTLRRIGAPPAFPPQRICYAKTKSHVVAKADGTYVAPDRAERSAHNKEQREKLDNRKAKAAAAMRQEQEEVHRQQMLIAGAEREAMSAPHHILFVEALPKAATEDMVSTLFKQVRRRGSMRLTAVAPRTVPGGTVARPDA